MGQNEILVWMRTQRLTGNHAYFTRAEIEKAVGNTGCSARNVKNQLSQLYGYGYLEIRWINMWQKRYRLRAKYVQEEMS